MGSPVSTNLSQRQGYFGLILQPQVGRPETLMSLPSIVVVEQTLKEATDLPRQYLGSFWPANSSCDIQILYLHQQLKPVYNVVKIITDFIELTVFAMFIKRGPETSPFSSDLAHKYTLQVAHYR